jgi:hypothetical protein
VKRWALRICLLLLLGAIVNVAVAWGCMGYAIHYGVNRPLLQAGPVLDELTPHERQWLPATHWFLTNRLAAWMMSGERFGVRVRQAQAVPFEWRDMWARQGYSHGLMTESAAGWPFLGMHGCDIVIWDGVVKEGDDYRWLLPIRERATFPMDPSALPLLPLWPGFAINTAFYALILWLLFAAPFALRRRRRIKRGLCPKCAYPVGTSDTCTECGTTVKMRSAA